VIFAGSAILFVVGMLMLLRSVIAIAVGLIKIAYYLIMFVVYLAVGSVASLLLAAQWCLRLGRRQPESEGIAVTINTTDEEDDFGRTIELPRSGWRRL
jgi:membrane protein implicated in regulation of membrane protease activity